MEAAGLGRPALASDIALARRIVADENDRETGRHAASDERSRLLGDPNENFLSHRRAVEHEGGRVGRGPSVRRHSGQPLLRPEDEARLVASAFSRLQHAHAGLVEQIARETVRIAVARPGLEA